MTDFLAGKLLKLDDCGCCEGIDYRTPTEVYNRSGLARIVYRVGTHPQFKRSMLARLSRLESNYGALTTRDDDDFAIALLDAWATVADVLTFYQERLIQESYLRTATERLSLRQLARLIGYQLRPGVAANTLLAFTLDDAPSSPTQIAIAAGIKVQSVPAPDEQPQMFETVEAITARAEWNAIRPRLQQPQTLTSLQSRITVRGTANNLKSGDKLLIAEPDDGKKYFKTVLTVDLNRTADTTTLQLVQNPAPEISTFDSPFLTAAFLGNAVAMPNQSQVSDLIINQSWQQSELMAQLAVQNWSFKELKINLARQLAVPQPPAKVYVFRIKASLFGYNAPQKIIYNNDGIPDISGGELQYKEWSTAADEANNVLFLDNVYREIVPNSYLAIITPDLPAPKLLKVESVEELSRTEYGLSGKTTRIEVDTNWWEADSFEEVIRQATVYAQSEGLTLTSVPITKKIKGDSILLDRLYPELQPGQTVILTGERANFEGVIQSEALTIKELNSSGGYTEIVLQQALKHAYVRDTVTINANVAPATHGETVSEILGSGNGAKAYQSFTLRQSPLTYISSDTTPSGALSTLEIRVNNLLWHEVPMLYGQKPGDRVFTTRQTETGNTVVKFGDGQTGARLATGVDNIEAKYRKGIGLMGNVEADRLTSLMSRPLGLKEVTNPLPATGGEASEALSDIRQNAPSTVLTLDRVVSLQDYEDFSRAFAGIAKALATWSWIGQQRGVLVTVAAPQGATVKANLIANLIEQLRQSGDPHVPLRVMSYRQALFTLGGGIKINADYLSASVLAEVKQTLLKTFSFERRAFGQGVALGEVLAVMQGVPGVVHVDLDYLQRRHPQVNGLKQPLPAAMPQRSGDRLLGAELLTINPFALDKLRELP